MNSLEFKKHITATLSPYGFKRAGKSWFVEKDGLLTVLTVSKHPYCEGFFVDCGAELVTTSYAKCPDADTLDIVAGFMFPSRPDYMPLAYQELAHEIPKRERGCYSIAEFYIDLELFPDDAVREAFSFNVKRRLSPMLHIDTLKALIQSDVFYVQTGKEKSLPKYGVSAEMISKYSLHFR